MYDLPYPAPPLALHDPPRPPRIPQAEMDFVSPELIIPPETITEESNMMFWFLMFVGHVICTIICSVLSCVGDYFDEEKPLTNGDILVNITVSFIPILNVVGIFVSFCHMIHNISKSDWGKKKFLSKSKND